ncbi:hypothetical protein SCHPADRAFT_939265 [Schizopora paradoxa]|uniref:Uncharacterized protein n=1 Tax=Schizopora paradoxa TaxID=27342 RepID=A0A0H2RYW0_9AGAM|nr:hypothetical protein SCHPADRAFT_939265 [Schizopora paradoxa]
MRKKQPQLRNDATLSYGGAEAPVLATPMLGDDTFPNMQVHPQNVIEPTDTDEPIPTANLPIGVGLYLGRVQPTLRERVSASESAVNDHERETSTPVPNVIDTAISALQHSSSLRYRYLHQAFPAQGVNSDSENQVTERVQSIARGSMPTSQAAGDDLRRGTSTPVPNAIGTAVSTLQYPSALHKSIDNSYLPLPVESEMVIRAPEPPPFLQVNFNLKMHLDPRNPFIAWYGATLRRRSLIAGRLLPCPR